MVPAAETGLGKTPVREALGRLVNEQLVDVTPRSGYRVRELTLQDVDEIFELCGVVWPETVALASQRITPAELDVLRTISFREGAGIEGTGEAIARSTIEVNRSFRATAAVPAFEGRSLAEVQRYVREWIERSYAETVDALRETPAVRSAALVPPQRD